MNDRPTREQVEIALEQAAEVAGVPECSQDDPDTILSAEVLALRADLEDAFEERARECGLADKQAHRAVEAEDALGTTRLELAEALGKLELARKEIEALKQEIKTIGADNNMEYILRGVYLAEKDNEIAKLKSEIEARDACIAAKDTVLKHILAYGHSAGHDLDAIAHSAWQDFLPQEDSK